MIELINPWWFAFSLTLVSLLAWLLHPFFSKWLKGLLSTFEVNILTNEVTSGVGANKLLKYWPPASTEWSTKGIRDAFFSLPQLPRLLDADAIKRTIADGDFFPAIGKTVG